MALFTYKKMNTGSVVSRGRESKEQRVRSFFRRVFVNKLKIRILAHIAKFTPI